MALTSHATRNYASEHLKDRHPDYSSPFPKVCLNPDPDVVTGATKNIDRPAYIERKRALIRFAISWQGPVHGEVARAFGKRRMPKLLETIALDEIDEETRAKSLRYFTGSLADQDLKVEAIENGAVSPLGKALKSANSEVRSLACRGLESLNLLAVGRRALLSGATLSDVTELLRDEEGDVRASAASCLQTAGRFPDGSEGILRSEVNVLAEAVGLLRSSEGPFTAEVECLSLLANTCQSDEGVVWALWRGAPKAVLQCACKLMSADASLLREAVRALRLLCHNPHGRVHVLEAGGVSWLSGVLKSGDKAVVRDASAAVMAMAVEKEAKLQVAKVCGPSLVRLISRSDSCDEPSRRNATAAILCAAELPAAQASFKGLLPPSSSLII